jgi:hypothetical protein
MDDLERARATVGDAYEHYLSLLPIFAEQIDGFVESTQTTFG